MPQLGFDLALSNEPHIAHMLCLPAHLNQQVPGLSVYDGKRGVSSDAINSLQR